MVRRRVQELPRRFQEGIAVDHKGRGPSLEYGISGQGGQAREVTRQLPHFIPVTPGVFESPTESSKEAADLGLRIMEEMKFRWRRSGVSVGLEQRQQLQEVLLTLLGRKRAQEE